MRFSSYKLAPVREKLAEAVDREDFDAARDLVQMTLDGGNEDLDAEDRLSLQWMEGALYVMAGETELAYACWSKLLASIERHAKTWKLDEPEVAEQVTRTFGDWANVAARLPDGPPRQLLAAFRRAEQFMRDHGLSHLEAELRHSQSVCYSSLEMYDKAVAAAERGLALRRSDPWGPGCRLDHHLEISADVLGNVGRFEEAWALLEEAAEKHPRASTYEERGWLRYREGRMEEALAEYEESERWKRSDHLVRGLLLAFAGRNEDAWLALSACAVANPKSAHTALWLYTLAGDDSALDRAAQPGGWSAALVSAARGGLSWEDLMARAEATDHAQRRRERIADVHLYRGVMAERRGDPAEAMRRYEAAVGQNCLREVGYWWAKWRLRG